MIRDRIVAGIRDGAVAERLQTDPELTLEKAIQMTRQSEMLKSQQSTVRAQQQEQSGTVVDYVESKHKLLPAKSNNYKSDSRCGRCGRTFHPPHQCPARDAVCRKCIKKGHFQHMCRSKSLAMVTTENTDYEFLGAVTSSQVDTASAGGQPWMVHLQMNNQLMKFKIDSGADVTVIPEADYLEARDGPLQSSTTILRGPNSIPLSVSGKFRGQLRKGDKVSYEDIFVVKDLQSSLLGRPAIESLNLVMRVEPINTTDHPMTKDVVMQQFPSLFGKLGKLQGSYHIKLNESAVPFSLNTPRRVAIPLLPKVQKELERMERIGVISRVEQATPWCAGMVIVPKPDGRIRICVDLTKLNQAVCRERHILPSVEQSLAMLGEAKVFSKIDANSGFWQIPLDKKSALLTTFIMPFGRYHFNRLPFGNTSAPEHFQRRMSEVLSDLEGVVCLIDDVLVHGKSQEEHDHRLKKVLERVKQVGLTLNVDKCEFSKSRIQFLGQVIDESGVSPDPDTTQAIMQLEQPNNVTEVRRYLGMLNQMSKFIPDLSSKTKPLRDLISAKNLWTWGPNQQRAFEETKQLISSPTVLALYDPLANTVVSADASAYGLGGVLTQKQPSGEWQPVSFISRSLTPTEQKYSQIEKEALALTWACEHFTQYLLGINFQLETDHKPLVPLFTSKNLEDLPIRIQRYRMRMMRYQFTIVHVPGKELVIADALSRSPLKHFCKIDKNLQADCDAYVNLILNSLPATDKRLKQIQQAQEEDETCKLLFQFCKEG